MLCQECKQRDATVHFTKIINSDKTEFHLCENCAREKGDFMMKGAEGGGLSFHNLLGGLLGFEQPTMSGRSGQGSTHQRCPNCGFSFQQFAQYGRFGCAECYTSFASQLEPMIRRVHGGATTHTGKVPQRTGGLIKKRKELQAMRNELQQKIQQEQFEEAAVLRDRIRELETSLEQGGK